MFFSLAKGGQIVIHLQVQLIGFAFLDILSVVQRFVGLCACLGKL
jgi:hypothetical protein